MLSENKIPDISREIDNKDIYNLLESEYSTLGPIWVNSQMEWMNGIYSSFKDHDKFLIVIYLINKTLDFYSRSFVRFTFDEFYKKDCVEIGKFNISEISIALDIPKESARRKINELEDIGAIKRLKKKIIIDRSSFGFVKPENTITRICRFLSVVSKISVDKKVTTKKINSEQLELVVKNNFSYIWKVYYDMQLPMMIRYKKVFNDLETFHIFGTCVVSQHLHTQNLNQGIMNRDEFFEIILKYTKNGINAMSISDITGIPRATVIRKLQKLVLNKNLTIDEKKHYRLSGNFLELMKKPQDIVLVNLAKFSTKVFNFELLK